MLLCDDRSIAGANRACFGRDRPTDVISLAYRPERRGGGWTGEVLVNVQRALEAGPRHGGPDRELALYLAHGCDHLAGAEDATPAQRAAMRARENRWLRAARARGLWAPGRLIGRMRKGRP